MLKNRLKCKVNIFMLKNLLHKLSWNHVSVIKMFVIFIVLYLGKIRCERSQTKFIERLIRIHIRMKYVAFLSQRIIIVGDLLPTSGR